MLRIVSLEQRLLRRIEQVNAFVRPPADASELISDMHHVVVVAVSSLYEQLV
jgi:hypothetical protein